MKKIAFKKVFAIFVMLSLLCAGCVPAQSGTAAEVKFPLAVRDCAPKQMSNFFDTKYYLTAGHVLYGWGRNYTYALGLPLPEQYTSDQPIELAEDVMDVEGCGYATFILKRDKSLWVIGNYPNPKTGGDYCEQFTKIADGIAEIKNINPGKFCCFVLKDTGDLCIIGSTNGSNICENPQLRPVDTNVTKLNGYFYEAEGDGAFINIRNSMTFVYYFSYYKQNNIWYLNENQNGTFATVKRHENVKYADAYAFYYIDINQNLCIDGYYETDDGEERRPTNGIKVIAEDVSECFGGEGIVCGYLTDNGDLYMIGYNYIDVFGSREAVSYGTVKVAENVKHIYRFDLNYHQPTLYFLKEDDSLWAIGDNSFIVGDGTVSISIYKENRSVYSELGLKVVGEIKEPVKIIDNVSEFTSSYYTKIAVTKDGKRYIWGSRAAAAVATELGYDPNDDPEHYITSKRAKDPLEANDWSTERQAYKRADVYLVPTLWEDVFGQPFPGD